MGRGQYDTSKAFAEDFDFNARFYLHSQKVNTVSLSGYRYICIDEDSADSRYLSSREEGFKNERQLRTKLLEAANCSEEEIKEYNVHTSYMHSYFNVIGLFKKGTPLSLADKRREIKRLMFDNEELAYAMKVCKGKTTNVMINVYNLCYASRSPLLTAIAFGLLFKMKYSMKGLYNAVAKYLH